MTGKEQRSEPLVCVIVINWNGWRDTIRCLESLLSTRYPTYSVVLVDNGSTDESIDRLSAWIALQPRAASPTSESSERFHLVKSDRNLGFTGGVNLGAMHAVARGADYVWLVNNDAVVFADTLASLVHCAVAERFDVLGSLVCEDAGAGRVEFAQGRLPWDLLGIATSRARILEGRSSWQTDWVTFASVLIARAPMTDRLAADGFVLDPGLFMYAEDVDFCVFCTRRRYRVGVSVLGRVVHRRSSSSGGTGSPRVYYYITRNRLALARRWFGAVSYVGFCAYYIATRLLLLCKHVIGGRYAIAAAVAEALLDGLRHKDGMWRHH